MEDAPVNECVQPGQRRNLVCNVLVPGSDSSVLPLGCALRPATARGVTAPLQPLHKEEYNMQKKGT